MSDFFDSEIIQEELKEINDMQEKIYGSLFGFGMMSKEEKLEHIDILTNLLEKQRVMYTRLSLENFVIYDKIFHFSKNFDKKLSDPVWETVSLKLKKYGPFINIDVFKYKKILRTLIDE